MNSTEIFKLCETSSKQQCPDGNLYWEADIVYRTCGRCLRISRSEKEVDKSNNDVVSIPSYVIKKNNKRGARHGPSDDNECIKRLKKCYIKRVKRNMEGTHPVLRGGTAEQDIMLFDRIALEIIHASKQKLREFETQNIGLKN